MFTVDAFDGCVYRVTTDSIARSVKDMFRMSQYSGQQVQIHVLCYVCGVISCSDLATRREGSVQ